MYLVRFNPWREFENMHSTFDRFFNNAVDRSFKEPRTIRTLESWSPAMDVHEDGSEIVYTVELPGFEKKEIDISVNEGLLAISAERNFEDKEETKYHHVERSYGKVYRNFRLPNSVDETKISAELKNGVLSLRLPKREEAKPRQIPVKGS